MITDSYEREICFVSLSISLNSVSTFILILRFVVNLSSLAFKPTQSSLGVAPASIYLLKWILWRKKTYQRLQQNLYEVAYLLISLAYSYRCQHAGEPSQVSGAPSILGFEAHEPKWHPSSSAPSSIRSLSRTFFLPVMIS